MSCYAPVLSQMNSALHQNILFLFTHTCSVPKILVFIILVIQLRIYATISINATCLISINLCHNLLIMLFTKTFIDSITMMPLHMYVNIKW